MLINEIKYALCGELFQFDYQCDMSNFSTMILELLIAAIAGIVIGLYFFEKERKQKTFDQLHQRIQDLEHSIELTKLEIQLQDTKKIISTQSNLIKEMKPIIEKQGEIIKQNQNQKLKRIGRLLGVLDPIISGIRNDVESELADFEENNRKLNAYQTKEDLIEFLESIVKDCNHVSELISAYEEIVDPEIFMILSSMTLDLSLCVTAIDANKEIQFVFSTLEHVDENLMKVWDLLNNNID